MIQFYCSLKLNFAILYVETEKHKLFHDFLLKLNLELSEKFVIQCSDQFKNTEEGRWQCNLELCEPDSKTNAKIYA